MGIKAFSTYFLHVCLYPVPQFPHWASVARLLFRVPTGMFKSHRTPRLKSSSLLPWLHFLLPTSGSGAGQSYLLSAHPRFQPIPVLALHVPFPGFFGLLALTMYGWFYFFGARLSCLSGYRANSTRVGTCECGVQASSQGPEQRPTDDGYSFRLAESVPNCAKTTSSFNVVVLKNGDLVRPVRNA